MIKMILCTVIDMRFLFCLLFPGPFSSFVISAAFSVSQTYFIHYSIINKPNSNKNKCRTIHFKPPNDPLQYTYIYVFICCCIFSFIFAVSTVILLFFSFFFLSSLYYYCLLLFQLIVCHIHNIHVLFVAIISEMITASFQLHMHE